MLGRAYDRFFRHIRVDEAWSRAVSATPKNAAVVYVLRNVSLIDYLALDYLTRERGLPPIGFVNELWPWVAPNMAALGRRPAKERLERALSAGHSAVLFLKRAPSALSPLGSTHRGRSEGDELLHVVLDLQRRGERDIVMMPQTLVWTMRPGKLGVSVTDVLFGPVDFPGDLRAAGQFLFNYKNCVLRAGEPLSLGDFLSAEAGTQDDDALVRRLTYSLLRKVERERRAITGPMQKPADRLREEVLRSPKLRAVIRDLAGPGAEEQARVVERARDLLREMEASPDPATLRGLELAVDRLVDRVYAGVDVDEEGLARLRHAASRGSIVLLPSHKSHVDYMLLAYVLRKSSLQVPIVAAGDNLSFFPVGPVFRRAGAFFIRRSFGGDRLYMAVVDAYIRRLLRDGHAIEFFLEGGRSRTGKLMAPKLGLLNMVVDAARSIEGREVTFVPISIGYERMMEDRSFAREVSGEPKQEESARALLKLSAVLSSRYGRANVQLGRFIELSELVAQSGGSEGQPLSPARRRALVTRLAHRVMTEINAVTAVTPGALVALVLLCGDRAGVPELELETQCARLTGLLVRRGARLSPSLTEPTGELRPTSIREATSTFIRAGLVEAHLPGDTSRGRLRRRTSARPGSGVVYVVSSGRRLELDLSKNHIVHFFLERAALSTALLTASPLPMTEAALGEAVASLARLLKHEFSLRYDASFTDLVETTLADMQATGELDRREGKVELGPGHDGLSGRGWASFYASTIQNFLEAYRVVARATRQLVGAGLTESDLSARALRLGQQMLLAGEIERSEAVCRPVFENAIRSFADLGYLKRGDKRLTLSDMFDSAEMAATIEARIAGIIPPRASREVW